ncbi:hypothetical protein V6N12_022213 [Hibiscus sabdariffa]|uniref:Uncharacterized protein n=1 Tax=Hibiscus sabdariffa TaxID=183260 RepID=A0ABR2FU45_9ROSI
MLANMWKSGESIVSNIERFQLEASRWNKKSFGHIGRRKHVLMVHIRGIERINEASPVPYFQELEDKLKGELTEVLRQEESLWFQRSRSEWIKGGDRNTKYYHRVAKVRHRRNVCSRIKLDDGQWCSEQSRIRQEVVAFFKGVFSSSRVMDWDINGWINPLTRVERMNLMRDVQAEEAADSFNSGVLC